jgi:hypothetical protein
MWTILLALLAEATPFEPAHVIISKSCSSLPPPPAAMRQEHRRAGGTSSLTGNDERNPFLHKSICFTNQEKG